MSPYQSEDWKKKGQTKQFLATLEVTKIPILLHWCR